MDCQLKGKVIAISGRLTGIGRAITMACLAQGAGVAVSYLETPVSEPHQKHRG